MWCVVFWVGWFGYLLWRCAVVVELLRLSFAMLGFVDLAGCWFVFRVFRGDFVFMWCGAALHWRVLVSGVRVR